MRIALAAVIHHGGADTTTTAARAGVAQIIVPHLLAVLGMRLGNETLSKRAAELGVRLRARQDPERGLEKLLEQQESDTPNRR